MTSYTILPGSFTLDSDFTSFGSATETQKLLHYLVREADGAEYKVSLVWNKRNIRTGKVDFRMFSFARKGAAVAVADKPGWVRQAQLREKLAHGGRLNVTERKALRYAGIAPRARVCVKPAPPPPVTPTQLAVTIGFLQAQVTKLTQELVQLKAQLSQVTADHARLLQIQRETQAQLDRVTAALRAALSG